MPKRTEMALPVPTRSLLRTSPDAAMLRVHPPTSPCPALSAHAEPKSKGYCQMFSSLAPPKKAQLRAPLSPLQTAWTGFDPNLCSGGSSSAGLTLVEIATARFFYTQQGHCDWHNVCLTPGARMVCSAFHSTVVSHQGCCQTWLVGDHSPLPITLPSAVSELFSGISSVSLHISTAQNV